MIKQPLCLYDITLFNLKIYMYLADSLFEKLKFIPCNNKHVIVAC